ncbi:MAG: Glu/Leu/Phe/Val dehydrogenase [bacterium]|nr:Glu/Leu/Phe/Val dehydrogenase [bacterium]
MEQNESLKQRYQRKLERLRTLVPMNDFIFKELYFCKRVFILQLRVPVHTGETQHLQAYIAHHCNPYDTGEDPYKGGLRKSVNLDQETIEGLAMDMTEKEGVADLPLGGGKAGICLEPNFAYTRKDHAQMNKAFVQEADTVNALGPRIYSTASDLGTSELDCDDIMKEYIKLHETELGSKRGVATGKSVENFGNPARKKATGRGGLIVARKMLSLLGVKKEAVTITIEGFGNVGGPTLELAEYEEYNFKPVAISDINGGIYNPNGLNIQAVIEHHKHHKTFAGYKEADSVTNDELLHLPCDMLIPAAIQNRLTTKTAGGVRAKYILELANGPTTEGGEKILLENGVVIIPDILANAGGVIVSWRELNVNKEHDRHAVERDSEEEETNEKLGKIMRHNTEQVFRISQEKKLGMRDAASFLSLSRIVPRLREKHPLYF